MGSGDREKGEDLQAEPEVNARDMLAGWGKSLTGPMQTVNRTEIQGFISACDATEDEGDIYVDNPEMFDGFLTRAFPKLGTRITKIAGTP